MCCIYNIEKCCARVSAWEEIYLNPTNLNLAFPNPKRGKPLDLFPMSKPAHNGISIYSISRIASSAFLIVVWEFC